MALLQNHTLDFAESFTLLYFIVLTTMQSFKKNIISFSSGNLQTDRQTEGHTMTKENFSARECCSEWHTYIMFSVGPRIVLPSAVPWKATEWRWSNTTSCMFVSTSCNEMESKILKTFLLINHCIGILTLV